MASRLTAAARLAGLLLAVFCAQASAQPRPDPAWPKAHPAAKETVLANWKRNTVVPFHPGALRYLKEKGISVPAPLTPSGA